MKRKTQRFIAMMLVCLMVWSCDPGPEWAGKYVAMDDSGTADAVALVLEPGGKGQWIAHQESTPLQWEERGGDVWLHFKTGGVVIARPHSADRGLAVEIPGAASFILRKVH